MTDIGADGRSIGATLSGSSRIVRAIYSSGSPGFCSNVPLSVSTDVVFLEREDALFGFADFVALAWSGGAELELAFEEAPGLAFFRGLLVEDLGFDADSAAVVFAEGALADRLLVGGCWFGSAGFGWRFRVGFGGVSGSVGCSGGIFAQPVAINNAIDLIGA